jgi:hypothetical protein
MAIKWKPTPGQSEFDRGTRNDRPACDFLCFLVVLRSKLQMSGRSSFVTEPPFASARVVQHCINSPTLFLSIANGGLSNHGLSPTSQATKSLQSGFSPCSSTTSPAGDPNCWDSFSLRSCGYCCQGLLHLLYEYLLWITACCGRYGQFVTNGTTNIIPCTNYLHQPTHKP